MAIENNRVCGQIVQDFGFVGLVRLVELNLQNILMNKVSVTVKPGDRNQTEILLGKDLYKDFSLITVYWYNRDWLQA